MMTIEIDGDRTELDLSACTTPKQANARLATLAIPGVILPLDQGSNVDDATYREAMLDRARLLEACAAQNRADEQAEVERLAYIFLAAGCETQGDPFTHEEWDAMQPVDKRAVLAGIRAVLADVHGASEDECSSREEAQKE